MKPDTKTKDLLIELLTRPFYIKSLLLSQSIYPIVQ